MCWTIDGISWNINWIWWRLNGIGRHIDGISWNIDEICWNMNGIRWEMNRICWNINGISWNINGICWKINGIRWTIDGICLPQGHPKPRPPAAEAEGNIHPARLLDSRCHHFGPRPSTNLRRIGTLGARLKLDFLRSAAEGQLTRDCPELSPNGPVSKIATKAWHKLDAGLTHLRFGRIVWLSTISYYLR